MERSVVHVTRGSCPLPAGELWCSYRTRGHCWLPVSGRKSNVDEEPKAQSHLSLGAQMPALAPLLGSLVAEAQAVSSPGTVPRQPPAVAISPATCSSLWPPPTTLSYLVPCGCVGAFPQHAAAASSPSSPPGKQAPFSSRPSVQTPNFARSKWRRFPP